MAADIKREVSVRCSKCGDVGTAELQVDPDLAALNGDPEAFIKAEAAALERLMLRTHVCKTEPAKG